MQTVEQLPNGRLGRLKTQIAHEQCRPRGVALRLKDLLSSLGQAGASGGRAVRPCQRRDVQPRAPGKVAAALDE